MLEMLQLSVLGLIHTIISLVAVAAGVVALVRYKEISPRQLAGQVYIVATILVCLTGFGLFRHGGFDKPHVLGIITLLGLGLAAVAGRTRTFGHYSRYVEAVTYSATFFFHTVPAVTETSTRLPIGAPLVTDREGLALQVVAGMLFVLFLIGAAVQVRWLRASESAGISAVA